MQKVKKISVRGPRYEGQATIVRSASHKSFVRYKDKRFDGVSVKENLSAAEAITFLKALRETK
jgi:hypothetical protein